jgi:hypothetical protein
MSGQDRNSMSTQDGQGATSNTTNKDSGKKDSGKNRTTISDQDKREPKQEVNHEKKLQNESGAE